MNPLDHSLERTVLVRAPRDTVFGYFTDPERWAAWWGPGSTVDPRPGGRALIRYPGGVEAAGEVLEVDAPRRFRFTYGFVSGSPIPAGSSRVTIDLAEHAVGTRLSLRHEFAEAAARDHHVQGWRYQLAVFANVVADAHHAGAETAADAWFAAWSEPDAGRREALLEGAVSPEVRFRDRYSNVEGLADLKPHLAAVHTFMAGSRVERRGEVSHCQGTVVAAWAAFGGDGQELGTGSNVFTLGPEGRIVDVVGLWRRAAGQPG